MFGWAHPANANESPLCSIGNEDKLRVVRIQTCATKVASQVFHLLETQLVDMRLQTAGKQIEITMTIGCEFRLAHSLASDVLITCLSRRNLSHSADSRRCWHSDSAISKPESCHEGYVPVSEAKSQEE